MLLFSTLQKIYKRLNSNQFHHAEIKLMIIDYVEISLESGHWVLSTELKEEPCVTWITIWNKNKYSSLWVLNIYNREIK